jgi:translation initiation factor RLI1
MSTIDELHQFACETDEDTYIDPASGYLVLTNQAHLKRGICCGNVCCHCPFEYINVISMPEQGAT